MPGQILQLQMQWSGAKFVAVIGVVQVSVRQPHFALKLIFRGDGRLRWREELLQVEPPIGIANQINFEAFYAHLADCCSRSAATTHDCKQIVGYSETSRGDQRSFAEVLAGRHS